MYLSTQSMNFDFLLHNTYIYYVVYRRINYYTIEELFLNLFSTNLNAIKHTLYILYYII